LVVTVLVTFAGGIFVAGDIIQLLGVAPVQTSKPSTTIAAPSVAGVCAFSPTFVITIANTVIVNLNSFDFIVFYLVIQR